MVDKLVDILTSSHDENRMKLNNFEYNQNEALNELANHIFKQLKQESATFESGVLQDSLEASCRKLQNAAPPKAPVKQQINLANYKTVKKTSTRNSSKENFRAVQK